MAFWPLAASSHSESVLVLPGLKPGWACGSGAGRQGTHQEGEVCEELAWLGSRVQAKPAAASPSRVGTFSHTTLLAFPGASVDSFLS